MYNPNFKMKRADLSSRISLKKILKPSTKNPKPYQQRERERMAKNPSPRRAWMLWSAAMRSLSTVAMKNAEATATISSSSSSSSNLYRRLSGLGASRDGSVAKVLDGWLREGNSVNKHHLFTFVKEFRKYKRFHHALQVSPTSFVTRRKCPPPLIL